MRHVFQMFQGHRFLGGRALANRVRNEACALITANPTAEVVLDFDRVEGVSHSFTDELLSPLDELLHEHVAERVFLVNCAPEVLEQLELVAMMHDLAMPGVGESGVVAV